MNRVARPRTTVQMLYKYDQYDSTVHMSEATQCYHNMKGRDTTKHKTTSHLTTSHMTQSHVTTSHIHTSQAEEKRTQRRSSWADHRPQ